MKNLDETYKQFLSKDYKKLFKLIKNSKLEIISIITSNRFSDKRRVLSTKYHGRLNGDEDHIIVIGSEGVEYGFHLYENFKEFEKDCKRLNLVFIDPDKL